MKCITTTIVLNVKLKSTGNVLKYEINQNYLKLFILCFKNMWKMNQNKSIEAKKLSVKSNAVTGRQLQVRDEQGNKEVLRFV